jgi:hypothetical protein
MVIFLILGFLIHLLLVQQVESAVQWVLRLEELLLEEPLLELAALEPLERGLEALVQHSGSAEPLEPLG